MSKRARKTKEVKAGDLVYHRWWGVCRVRSVSYHLMEGKKEAFYSAYDVIGNEHCLTASGLSPLQNRDEDVQHRMAETLSYILTTKAEVGAFDSN